MTDDRRRREGWGRKAESLAAFALRLKGYRVLARRLRTPAGEIDLIVRRRWAIHIIICLERIRRLGKFKPRHLDRISGPGFWVRFLDDRCGRFRDDAMKLA